jgi:DNA-directed RNA polymerase specialized sigma24 family protein
MLSGLTDRRREAVYLFYYKDFCYQQIAEILEINIGGVYKLIYRALDVLRSSAKMGI